MFHTNFIMLVDEHVIMRQAAFMVFCDAKVRELCPALFAHPLQILRYQRSDLLVSLGELLTVWQGVEIKALLCEMDPRLRDCAHLRVRT